MSYHGLGLYRSTIFLYIYIYIPQIWFIIIYNRCNQVQFDIKASILSGTFFFVEIFKIHSFLLLSEMQNYSLLLMN